MIVLVVGSGGREHALARKIAEDPQVTEVHCAPGNPGTAKIAVNHPINVVDGPTVASLALKLGANLVVIGPEAPLVAGVADFVRETGIPCFGPNRAAAQLEGSKAFAKSVMNAAKVPTGKYYTCTSREEVISAMEEFGSPYVIKADGLAAGKGVVVTQDRQVALDHAAQCEKVVVEEYLSGPEVSLFCITDGKTVLPMNPAQDFKRVADNDKGPNTGGMGAYTPLDWVDDDLTETVVETVVKPTLDQMEKQGTPFSGLLYVGLAITKNGPKVIEFNVRFGDPETQALLATLKSPLAQVLYQAATGTLHETEKLKWKGSAVCVVLAAQGYPESPKKGGQIVLPPDDSSAWVIQAGTELNCAGELIANGGRVLSVVGKGKNLMKARKRAYRLLDEICYEDGFYRKDIAQWAVQEQKLHLNQE